MNEQEWIKKLEQEGFENIRVIQFEAWFDPGEHTHDVHTVHVILSGELSITDHEGTMTYRQGDRVEFPVGTKHMAKGGGNAGSMIVGG